MKTKHELKNGTILEPGKCYFTTTKVLRRTVHNYAKVIGFDGDSVVAKSIKDGSHLDFFHMNLKSDWKPYEDKVEESKDLDTLRPYFKEFLLSKNIEFAGWFPNPPRVTQTERYFSLDEAQKRGLTLNF